MQATTLDLTRRGLMAGLCGATASAALTPARAAGGDTSPSYRSAVDLIQALVAGQISARELLDAMHWTHRSARPEGQRCSRARL